MTAVLFPDCSVIAAQQMATAGGFIFVAVSSKFQTNR
jgi:hypothetical protein